MSSRLRIRSMALPLATLGFLVAQLVDPSPVWKGVLVTLAGVWLLSFLWAQALQKNLRLERTMRYSWAQVGDRLEEQFSLSNDSIVPAIWLEISDRSTLPGYSVARAIGIEGQSQSTWHTEGLCVQRGVYSLGYTTLLTGDPLGVYRAEIILPEVMTLTVMPPVISLPFIEIAAGGWQGEGRPQAHSTEQTVRAETVRPYVLGDSMRLLHWPTTARLNQPYVRVLEAAPTSDWWIVLDFDARVHVDIDSPQSSSELGVILAASLAERGLRARRSVGFAASGRQPVCIRPGAGGRQRWEIMRALATLEPGDKGLAVLLEGLAPTLGREASLIVITPSLDSDWIMSLTRLSWRGFTTTAVLIDPSSFGMYRSAEPLSELLSEAGISNYITGRVLFESPEARPGLGGQWEWRVLPTGKAIPVRRPTDMIWKNLR